MPHSGSLVDSDDFLYLGGTRKKWTVCRVEPVDEARERRLRRERREDLARYRLSLKYDDSVARQVARDALNRRRGIDPDEQTFVRIMRQEEQRRREWEQRHTEQQRVAAEVAEVRRHEVDTKRRNVRMVTIRHPEVVGTPKVPESTLDIWRERGWHLA